METPAPTQRTTSWRRWLPRYSLRTFLIAVLLVGSITGYFASIWRHVTQQRAIVEEIRAAGGEVHYDYEFEHGEDLRTTRDLSFPNWEYSQTEDGRMQRTRSTPEGTITELEMPPGTQIIRSIFGDDAYAHVTAVHWNALTSNAARPFDVHLLRRLPKLNEIWLRDEQVNDEWLGLLAETCHLKSVTLMGNEHSRATANGLASLANRRTLEHLDMSGAWLREDTLRGVSELRQLLSLDLDYLDATAHQGSVFEQIQSLTRLRELSLSFSKNIDDRGSQLLKQLNQLQLLTLGWTNISDETAAHLPALTQLVWLDLAGTKITDESMSSIAELPNLVRLSVRQTGVGNRGLNRAYALTDLRQLLLDGTKITNDGLAGIEKLSDLETLMINQTAVDDDGLHYLYALKKLKLVSVGPNVSEAAAEELRKALPDCEVHVLNPLPPTHFEEGGN